MVRISYKNNRREDLRRLQDIYDNVYRACTNLNNIENHNKNAGTLGTFIPVASQAPVSLVNSLVLRYLTAVHVMQMESPLPLSAPRFRGVGLDSEVRLTLAFLALLQETDRFAPLVTLCFPGGRNTPSRARGRPVSWNRPPFGQAFSNTTRSTGG